jgi:hypothetical protein
MQSSIYLLTFINNFFGSIELIAAGASVGGHWHVA